jgi:general secretion pathway protein G
MRIGDQRGFTLIELLIVVAIIGIIAAIAIPNLLNAIDRGKQKRTMADIRSIGTAIESYAVDTNRYPTSASISALASVLQPGYIRTLPTTDGWKNTLVYTPSAGTGYTLGSGGKDGGALTVIGPGGGTTSFNDAIIFIDGSFVQFPEGQQQ